MFQIGGKGEIWRTSRTECRLLQSKDSVKISVQKVPDWALRGIFSLPPHDAAPRALAQNI